MTRQGPREAHGPDGVRRLALGLAGALLLAGCTTTAAPAGPAPATPQVATAAATTADQHARIVASYGGVYRDTDLERALVRIVGRLVAASDEPGRSYAVTILNADAINAFALPDGYLYVTRGLLALAADASEVAAVLAHEMAHITANHASLRQEQARSAAIVNGVITDAVGEGAGVAAAALNDRTLTGFSRQQELEADAIGIRTIALAGYDPYAASRFLEAMARFEAYRGAGAGQQDFLISHPSTPDRIALAVATAGAFGPPGTGELDRDRYLTALDGVVFGDDRQQGFVRGRAFYHATLGIAFAVPEGFVLDNTLSAVLAIDADGTALRFDSVTLGAGESLAAYLNSGWVSGLRTGSIRALTIDGLPALSASAAAGGWEFRITLIEIGGTAYRFILGKDRATAAFEQAAAAIAGSFRRLTAEEAAGLRPLTLRVATVGAADTAETMAARMRGVDRPLELFLVLNGLEPGAGLPPGLRVKIVSE